MKPMSPYGGLSQYFWDTYIDLCLQQWFEQKGGEYAPIPFPSANPITYSPKSTSAPAKKQNQPDSFVDPLRRPERGGSFDEVL